FRATMAARAGAGKAQRRDQFPVAVSMQWGIRQDEVNPVGPGVGHNRPTPGVKDVSPGVVVENRTVIYFQAEAIRAELPDAASEMLSGSPWRLHRALDVHTLVEIEGAVRSPAESIQRVVRILRAEACQQAVMLVGLPTAGGIAEVPKRVALTHVDS